MKKIENFENVVASNGSSYKRIPDGAYCVAVTNVVDVPEKEYLRIEFDVCKGEYKRFYRNEYDNDTRENKRWGGSLIRSYKSTALPMFKAFTTSVEKSNKNFKWDWDESKLINKMFCVVLATEEYLTTTGKVRERTYVASVHSLEAMEKGDYKVPEPKKLDANAKTVATSGNAEFVNPFGEEPKAVETKTKAEANPWDDDDAENPFGD